MTYRPETDFSFIPPATAATFATLSTGQSPENVATVAGVATNEREKYRSARQSVASVAIVAGAVREKKAPPSPLSILRKAGLVPVLAGDSFEVLGLENLPEDRREKCRQYCREHEPEILSELKTEEWYWKVFHLSWLKDAGLALSLNESRQVAWEILPAFQKIWDLGPEQRIADTAWECWRYACKHHREILAALEPCKGWKPSQPSGGCTTLEEFNNELEKERRRGVMTFCPFHDMWLLRKDCPGWCGRWNEPLTNAEREYWAALSPFTRPRAA